jgi:Uma2 family endonuclease
MASPTSLTRNLAVISSSVDAEDLPLLYEDDKEADLGESNPHVIADEILHVALTAHLASRPECRVYSNMNLYYYDVTSEEISALPYVSPDTMVVIPFQPLDETIRSYRIGRDGPAPVLTMEVLSERSHEQRDLNEKVTLYAKLGVAEYILVDVTGLYLPQRLLLKRLQPDRTWKDEQDPDGGVTSQLGFRLIIDTDGQLRVLDATTGRRYVRPLEAEMRIRELEAAEIRVHELEAELARLRHQLQGRPNP